MLKQAFVLACGVVGIACVGLFAAQAAAPVPSEALDFSRPINGIQLSQSQNQQACKDKCHKEFQNCTPVSSKNLDACRDTWRACDAACPQ